MLESAKRCFHSLAELIGKELFLKLCTDYVETNLKKTDHSINEGAKTPEPYYHPSIIYEWNQGTDSISLR